MTNITEEERRRRAFERGVTAALQYLGGIPHKGAWREAARLKIGDDERADFVDGFLSQLDLISRKPTDFDDH
jgi:hypothetical protein